MPKTELNTNLNMNQFIELVERYGIKPSDLGITSNYLYKIRKGERKPSSELYNRLVELIRKIEGKFEGDTPSMVDRPGFEPGTSRMPTEVDMTVPMRVISDGHMTSHMTSHIAIPNAQQSLNGNLVNLIPTIESLINQTWLSWMKMRYSSRGHAIYMYTTAKKYLIHILKNPPLLKTLSSRRAKAVLEAIASLRDYARLNGIELNIDTKFLRKFLPPARIEEITESILEYELSEGKTKDIVSQAVEQVQEVMKHDTMFKIPVLIAFFTGLRSTEIKHMLDRWNSLRKIEIIDGVVLVELNYDRVKKKAYITLMPKRLVELINDWVKENKLSVNWKDHVRHRLGVRLGLFRKSFQAITTTYLDKAERELLLGHLKSIQVKHYIKHIKSIAQRYLEAYKNYLHILDSLNPN